MQGGCGEGKVTDITDLYNIIEEHVLPFGPYIGERFKFTDNNADHTAHK